MLSSFSGLLLFIVAAHCLSHNSYTSDAAAKNNTSPQRTEHPEPPNLDVPEIVNSKSREKLFKP